MVNYLPWIHEEKIFKQIKTNAQQNQVPLGQNLKHMLANELYKFNKNNTVNKTKHNKSICTPNKISHQIYSWYSLVNTIKALNISCFE